MKRGLTLTEVLLAGALSLLLLGLVTQTVLLCRKTWRRNSLHQSAQSATLVAVTRLREDFKRSKPGSAVISGPVLSFLSYDDGSQRVAWNPTGELAWRCWIQYRWEGSVLSRRQQPFSPFPPAWPAGAVSQRLAPGLVRCHWAVSGNRLEVQVESRAEEVASYSHLRMLPALYGQD